MFKLDDNMIRPRKNNKDSWTHASYFKNYNNFQDSGALPPKPKFSSDRKYAKNEGKPVAKAVVHQIENYCDKSTLHGLRYVGDTSLSFGERIFWLVAFISAITFAIYYITNIFDKWHNNPILIAFSPFDANLNDIPFPSITICNMNQVKKVEADRILDGGGSNAERYLLSSFCNESKAFTNKDEAPGYAALQAFMIKAGHSCSDMLKSCMWQSDLIDCEQFFNNYLTDEGLCCSFNRLPPENLFRNPNDIAQLNQTFAPFIYDWSPETGFPDKNVGNRSVSPLRPVGAGVHLGLSLVIDVQTDDYFCSSTDSVGFKVIFSNPIETPEVADYGYLVSPGDEIRLTILPEIQEASSAIRGISVAKRQCYFENERPLQYYRTYTQKNCNLECQSNYTLLMCKCIPYYLPSKNSLSKHKTESKLVKICGQKDVKCMKQAKEDMELVYGSGSSCHCLPGCFEMKFDKEATVSDLYKLHARHEMGVDVYANEYFVKNMAVVHFFFKETKFRKQVKNEIYGFTEALSNIGGLLGLCLGFSFLSLIELIYYLTLKVLCSFIISRKRDNKKVKNHNNIETYSNNVIPFLK